MTDFVPPIVDRLHDLLNTSPTMPSKGDIEKVLRTLEAQILAATLNNPPVRDAHGIAG